MLGSLHKHSCKSSLIVVGSVIGAVPPTMFHDPSSITSTDMPPGNVMLVGGTNGEIIPELVSAIHAGPVIVVIFPFAFTTGVVTLGQYIHHDPDSVEAAHTGVNTGSWYLKSHV